ncbi:MAG TPA: response regulator transcription factor [Haliangiales bacterium]|nr:response regulator transcription factor [Haliangiales bacterium]
MTAQEILIVEDDESIAAGLALNLKIEGYAPSAVGDGDAAWKLLRSRTVDLVLLDISLPGASGLDILDRMRKSGDRTPVIVLSARRDEFDKVAALRLGADDYVTKPFALAELMARVVAVLRRSPDRDVSRDAEPRDALGFSDIVVNLATRQVTRGGRDVKLTHLEFELLAHFLQNPTRVFAREDLLREVWGLAKASRRTVDNFVAQLRSKLERDPEAPRHLVTVRGSGYRFDP